MQANPSIFLSHCSADKKFARQLKSHLVAAGASVWFDEAEIKLGDSLINKISDGISSTDYLAVILSPDSVASSWVQREVEIALNQEIQGKRVHVLPLLYRDCEIPQFLRGKRYADFREENGFLPALNEIKARLDLPLSSTEEDEDSTEAMRLQSFMLHEISTQSAMVHQGLRNLAEFQAERESPKRLKERLQVMTAATSLQLHLIQSFFLTQQFNEGRYSPRIRSVEIGRIIRSITKSFAFRVRDRGQKFILDIAKPQEIPCDEGLIRIALFNILDNAVKYSLRDTEIRILGKKTPDYYSISFENRGLPIPDDAKIHLFSRGYRGPHAKAAVPGTGIGLYTTDMIMSAHGGELKLDSGADKHFHRFTLTIPMRY